MNARKEATSLLPQKSYWDHSGKMAVTQPSSGTFLGPELFNCNCIQLVWWSSQEPDNRFDVLSALLERKTDIPVWETRCRKQQPSQKQLTRDRDYHTCAWSHHSLPRNVLSSSCSSSSKTAQTTSPLTMCLYPKAKSDWHMASHCILWPSPIERWGQFLFLFKRGWEGLWDCFDL